MSFFKQDIAISQLPFYHGKLDTANAIRYLSSMRSGGFIVYKDSVQNLDCVAYRDQTNTIQIRILIIDAKIEKPVFNDNFIQCKSVYQLISSSENFLYPINKQCELTKIRYPNKLMLKTYYFVV